MFPIQNKNFYSPSIKSYIAKQIKTNYKPVCQEQEPPIFIRVSKYDSSWQGFCTAEISALNTEGAAWHLDSSKLRWSVLYSRRWLETPSL